MSFIIEVSVGGQARGQAVVGLVAPCVGVDGSGQVQLQPTRSTAMAVFAERDGVLYAMSTNEREPAWLGRTRLGTAWTPMPPSMCLQVGLARVTAQTQPAGASARAAGSLAAPPSGATRVRGVASPHEGKLADSGSNPPVVWGRSGDAPSLHPSAATPSTPLQSVPFRLEPEHVHARSGAHGALGCGDPKTKARPGQARRLGLVGLTAVAVVAIVGLALARGSRAEQARGRASHDGAKAAVAAVTPTAPPATGASPAPAAPVDSSAVVPPTPEPAHGKRDVGKAAAAKAAAAAALLTPEAEGEHAVAEAMFSGDYARALKACDALVKAHPEEPRYGVMARVLRTKASRVRR